MGDVLVAAVISSLAGIILGGAGAALMVWRPIQRDVSAIATDLAVVKNQVVGLVSWQEAFDRGQAAELQELRRQTMKGGE